MTHRARRAAAVLGAGLAVLAAAARPDTPSEDEAEFARRHGIGEACDTVAIAEKLERTLQLPLQRLGGGAQVVEFRYVESGWPLGLAATDAERPPRLGDAPPEGILDVPPPRPPLRRFGTFVLGPQGDRFPFVLEADPADWRGATLRVAKDGRGDLARASPLRNLASSSSATKAFATIVVLPLTFASAAGTRTHPIVLWAFAHAGGDALRYYPVCHWRALVELPYSGKRAFAVLYDVRGRGDLSAGVLALLDASYSASELFAGADGEDRFWQATADGAPWRTRNFVGVGQAVLTDRESVRLREVAPLGDRALLEIERR